MKSFWAAVAKIGAQILVYAAEHPDQVQAIINDIQAVKK